MKKKASDLFLKSEDGLNGINYAFYAVAIITVVVLFRFLTFQAGLYVVQQHLQDSLHIAGSAGLAYNYGDASLYESDLNRLYVVDLAKGSTSNAWNPGEEQQALALGRWIAEKYVNKMGLVGDSESSPKIHPSDSMMTSMCGEDAEVLLSHLSVYQPLYQRKVKKQPATPNTPPFEISYDYKYADDKYRLVKYEYSISDNKVTGVTKKYYQAADLNTFGQELYLKNGTGSLVSGTTIDMCTQTVLHGVNNIFAGVSTQTPSWGNTIKKYYSDGKNGYATLEYRELERLSNPGSFFSDNPTRMSYGIEVWEAVDIVPATDDSRTKH